MPTQVIEIDLSSAAEPVVLRNDVNALFVLLTDNGRPVEIVRMSRPAVGALSLRDIPHRVQRAAEVARIGDGESTLTTSLSVVIPTRERPEDLARCLESLGSKTSLEIIVVDNAPRTNRTAAVAERFRVRYVMEPVAGIDNARNAGLAVAKGDIVAFIDDDAVASANWLEAISAPFADARVGCSTGLVLPLELETSAQEDFERYCYHRRDLQAHVYSRDDLRPSAAGVVGMGANMAFRRKLLLDLGRFDPRLGTGTSTRAGDETDMFARVLDAGWMIVYTPDAFVWHRHRRTTRELRSCVFGYGVGLYSMLTKRLFEARDLGAIITAGRWLLGPPLKAVRARIAGTPSPPWRIVLAETAGAPLGPFCFWYEAWRSRARARSSAE